MAVNNIVDKSRDNGYNPKPKVEGWGIGGRRKEDREEKVCKGRGEKEKEEGGKGNL